ncbi:sulfatase-like hydrolase/transferase [Flammeovirga yaeyamensis]|uniref:Sulfatase-like hydrolase/transferase n=1 Tax=Flammeovirga yaeyamensis TaxID=367791 RepID=A0AAX1NAS2_9BACT|nr:sulfatase [Flammeovirga yaeyamensis]MBB3699953.1 arylsulfatase A-like enzyme [Flammeovirga yaeyamensis]NMF37608.1 sulfatase [Flammeovirga yaeyamensis]QWG04664.1 sulfatase-like hydrolase/transferase [Flammeovirga yaeyamensis]
MKLQSIFFSFFIVLLISCNSSNQIAKDTKTKQPNILWIFVEDLSPYIGCYGDSVNKDHTPTIDGMASNGVLFERAYATAPVCSASRSAMMTGKMQTTIGVHNHRSNRTTEGEVVPENLRIHLPDYIQKSVPEMMRAAGYFTFNSGKDDYNFHYDRRSFFSVGTKSDYVAGMNGWQGNVAEHRLSFTEDTWNARKDKDQPWFGQIELKGGKEQKTKLLAKDAILGLDDVPLPPYFPEVESQKKAWVKHYNNIRTTDIKVQQILDLLEKDGELENTIVFFFSDHGSNTSLRHKQFCYEEGVHVPLVIQGNHPYLKSGVRRKDMVSLLDVSATTLAMGGIQIPAYFDGQDLFSKDHKEREYVIGARDRCDFTIDRIRTVRSDKYRYIRNYFTDRPLMQPSYRDRQGVVKDMRKLHAEGKLTPYQDAFWFGERPEEELYNMEKDPFQINNLAQNTKFKNALIEHRTVLEKWVKETDDKGQYPEDPQQLKATYDLWKEKPQFKNAKVNPEYHQFM